MKDLFALSAYPIKGTYRGLKEGLDEKLHPAIRFDELHVSVRARILEPDTHFVVFSLQPLVDVKGGHNPNGQNS